MDINAINRLGLKENTVRTPAATAEPAARVREGGQAESGTGAQVSLDRKDVDAAVEKASRQMEAQGVSLKFRVLEDAKGIQVEMVDPDNDKVVRKIPSDELLKLSESIKQGAHLFDRTL